MAEIKGEKEATPMGEGACGLDRSLAYARDRGWKLETGRSCWGAGYLPDRGRKTEDREKLTWRLGDEVTR